MTADGAETPPIARALVYAGLARYEEATKAFEECVANCSGHILLLRSEPRISAMAEERGWMRLLDPLGLPGAEGAGKR